MGEADRMGIDLIAGGRVKTGHRKDAASEDVYLKLLIKLYRFLERRTDASFNKVVLQRLFQSNTNRPPVTISFIARQMKDKTDKTAVFVGTVTNDIRMLDVPKLSIGCVLLRGKRTARVANRYFGKVAEGARPRVRSKGRKFEKARGRRRSRGFKC